MSNPSKGSKLLYPNLNIELEKMSKEESDLSSSVTYKLETLFQWVDKYDGSNQKLNEFIINTDAAFELASESQNSILLAYAKKQLTGRAKMITSTKIISSWRQLKEFLIESFSPRQSIDELILEAQTCRQLPNESIMDFTLRLDILDSKFIKAINLEDSNPIELPGLLKMKDNICLRAFIAGVSPTYQNLLTLKEPKNYQEASYCCLKSENENKINRSHEQYKRKPNFCTFCRKNNHTTANCYKQLNQAINPRHNENTFVKSEAKIHNTNSYTIPQPKLFCIGNGKRLELHVTNAQRTQTRLNYTITYYHEQQKKVVHSQGREIIYNVYKFMQAEKAANQLTIPLSSLQERVAAATGVGLSTVQRIVREASRKPEDAKFSSPRKTINITKRCGVSDGFEEEIKYSLLKKIWMLYAQEHWTKSYDLKSAVERLYEELGALEFDADHDAIYGMERYYAVQQCEELRDKYKIGRKVCRKFLQGKTCSQCLVKRISEIGLRHFLDTVNKYIKDCSDSSSSSDEEVFKAVEQMVKRRLKKKKNQKKAKVEALLNLFNNLLKDSLNHSLKLNTIFSSNFCRELSDRFSKGIEICNKYLNGNICLKCLQIQLFSNNLEEYF
ncbi:hypothetical protein FQA39_LY18353 [Lamprigera yunnana]|nr:hypothetical protein FQA39_LY18353 [Lamprigera yunnana]